MSWNQKKNQEIDCESLNKYFLRSSIKNVFNYTHFIHVFSEFVYLYNLTVNSFSFPLIIPFCLNLFLPKRFFTSIQIQNKYCYLRPKINRKIYTLVQFIQKNGAIKNIQTQFEKREKPLCFSQHWTTRKIVGGLKTRQTFLCVPFRSWSFFKYMVYVESIYVNIILTRDDTSK